jgi:hypothetical protein
MTTELINLKRKDLNGKSGYKYYKQKYGDRFVYIGREDWRFKRWPGSIWANPDNRSKTFAERVESYKKHLLYGKGKHLLLRIPELKGKVLACWCKGDHECHGEVLLELVATLKD